MTTETLKPFIPTSRCIDNPSAMRPNATKHCQRRSSLSVIILSALALILTLVLFGFTIWQIQRISHLEANVKQLDKVILSMRNRLGLKNLDDDADYGKEYDHSFIDEPTMLVDGDDQDGLIDREDDEDIEDEDEDDEDDEFDYEEFRKKLAAMNYSDDMDDEVVDAQENEKEDDTADSVVENEEASETSDEEDMDLSDEGDLYNDFSKFNATRKKKTNSRISRAIAPDISGEGEEKNENPISESINNNYHDNQQTRVLMLRIPSQRSDVFDSKIDRKPSAKEQTGKTHSTKRRLDSRRYKNRIIKNAKSARQTQVTTNTPAAHFHLNRKIPDRYTSIRVDSYSGDMYIGHPSWPNEVDVDNFFKVENGVLTVYESGLYYVYAQVCYNNTHDQNGFVIFHGHKPFLQCLNTVPTNMPHKIHTCHTSGLIFLKENETIHLRDFHSDRNAILKESNNRSYFGLIKI